MIMTILVSSMWLLSNFWNFLNVKQASSDDYTLTTVGEGSEGCSLFLWSSKHSSLNVPGRHQKRSLSAFLVRRKRLLCILNSFQHQTFHFFTRLFFTWSKYCALSEEPKANIPRPLVLSIYCLKASQSKFGLELPPFFTKIITSFEIFWERCSPKIVLRMEHIFWAIKCLTVASLEINEDSRNASSWAQFG